MKKLLLLIFIGLPFITWGQTIGFSFFGAERYGGFENITTFMDKKMGTSFPMSCSEGGFSVFYDITYLEAYFGLRIANGYEGEMFVSSPIIDIERKGTNLDYTALTFGLLAKYPLKRPIYTQLLKPYGIEYNTSPLFGFEFDAVLDAELDGKSVNKPFNWSQIWLNFGLEWEVRFAASHNIRWGFLYGFRLPVKAEKNLAGDMAKQLEQSFYRDFDTIPDINNRILTGRGITFKIAYGYKLK